MSYNSKIVCEVDVNPVANASCVCGMNCAGTCAIACGGNCDGCAGTCSSCAYNCSGMGGSTKIAPEVKF